MTCGFFVPVVSTRARRNPQMTDVGRTQHGPQAAFGTDAVLGTESRLALIPRRSILRRCSALARAAQEGQP